MKIAIVMACLHTGGAERVVATLANYWNDNEHSVTIILLTQRSYGDYEISETVNIIELAAGAESPNIFYALRANLYRIFALRSAIKKCDSDVILSFGDTTNILSCISCFFIRSKLIVAEINDAVERNLGLVRNIIRPYLYRNVASEVVLQTLRGKHKAARVWNIPNIEVIPNPLNPLFESTLPVKSFREPRIISVGRLIPLKRHDWVISAFAEINTKYPEWSLDIYGEGPERERLLSLITALNLHDKVHLRGFSKDIRAEYLNAEIYCMASTTEGLPNSLMEALACGCACISTDCETGPDDILGSGKYGVLCETEDFQAYVLALDRMISSESLRLSYRSLSEESSARYSLPQVSSMWMDLFNRKITS